MTHTLRPLLLSAAVLVAASSAASADSKSHRKAAEDLLKVMGVDKQLQPAIDQMLDIQVKANPQIAPFRDTMKEFLTKHMSWESLKDDYVTIYADAFSENELNDIRAFYATPTGKKMIQRMPELMSKGMQVGAQRVQEHQAELRQMIQDAAGKKSVEQ